MLVHDDTRLVGASSVPQVHLSFWEASVAPGHWDLIDAWDGLWSIDGIQDLAKGESAVWGLDPDRLRIAKFHENYVNLHGIRHLPLSTNLRGLAWVDEAEEGCPEDLDGDEVWRSVGVPTWRAPEPVLKLPAEELRPNWVLETTWTLEAAACGTAPASMGEAP